ncbi:MAG: histidine kinase [Muricoprocola sp.]
MFRKVINHVKSHMAYSFIGTGIVLFLFAAFFFQSFLQNEYMQFLLAETTKTEQAVLDASANNINSMLREALRLGADTVRNSEFYELVENVKESNGATRDTMRLDLKLNNITHYQGNIAATAVVTEDGLLREYGRYWDKSVHSDLWHGDNLEVLLALYEQVMEKTKERTASSYVISTKPLTHEDFPEMLLFHIAYPLVGNHVDKTDSCAVVVFSIRLDNIIQASALSNAEQGDYISEYITDSDGTVLYHRNSKLQGENERYLSTNQIEELEKPLNYWGWTIHIDIDSNRMHRKVSEMFGEGVVVYLILLFFCIVIWSVLLWRILEPVGDIGKAMREICQGDYGGEIKIRGTHELWQLAQQYNHTVQALEMQREETKREYEEKTITLQRCNEAEREALESQINAHFLCNTLGAINYSAIENGDTEVSILLKNLSGILYYTFSKETKLVTLGEEIDWVCQYLYLQKYRLMDVFDYEIIFPEEYNEWPCCKLFLQPFVENSILHGFEGWESGGKIVISGKESGSRLVMTIEDNGCGMEKDISDAINKTLSGNAGIERNHLGVGIQNVVARLRMYYGPEMEVKLETAPGKGTRFILWLPIPADILKENEETDVED